MKKTSNIALTGILGAASLAVSFIEHLILAAAPLPAGIKPGLSNVVVMFAASVLPLPWALSLALIKSLFAAMLSGVTSGIISLGGGLPSVLIMYFLLKIPSKKGFSYMGVSVFSAVTHNLGQLTAASLLMGSLLYRAYAPVLLVSGTVFGLVTGTIVRIVMPKAKKLVKS